MDMSVSTWNLIEVMPQACVIIDIQQMRVLVRNHAAKTYFGIEPDCSTEAVAQIMTHAPSTEAMSAALRKELHLKGKSILQHISIKTLSHESEHYDLHIAYVDASRETVYVIFALSAHELQRMAQQNTYYDTISEAAYSYPFHLDVKTRRAEFFDPAIEDKFHMTMVMENFPEPVLTFNYLCEEDKDDYLAVVDRMYKGEPPQGSFRFYDLKGELLRYTVNYVVNRDSEGAPIDVIGDFIIQSDTKVEPEVNALSGVEQGQKLVLAHQIKAHFFFNTLNTISALCKQDAAKADHAICTFASYMRAYMHLINEYEMIFFEQELLLVKSTLEIEKLRFPESFHYELELEVTDFDIPPLTLQPIVENALLHGLRRTGHHGTLKIGTHMSGDTITVTISDNGTGFDTSVLAKTKSIGLKNLTRRIEMMAGGTVCIQSQLGEGTQAVITLPTIPAQQGIPPGY